MAQNYRDAIFRLPSLRKQSSVWEQPANRLTRRHASLYCGMALLMSSPPLHVVVLLPVRDDWISAAELIASLDRTISASKSNVCLDVLMVDDASVESWLSTQFDFRFSVVRRVQVLRLLRNLGHQRAIAAGLVHIEAKMPCEAVLVMDADGEDTPSGALQLIEEFLQARGKVLVFAERARRTESLMFRAFYQTYKALHRILTGISVRVGNFSIMPRTYLSTMIVVSELWNHYAAAVFRSRLSFTMIPIPRGHRIAGSSHMNFAALVIHGLSAVSVFAEEVGVRLLIGTLSGSLGVVIGFAIFLLVRMLTNHSLPGWTNYVIGTLSIILIQVVTIAACFTFFMLSGRAAMAFIPRRDAPLFVKEVLNIYPND
jgi:glycosyltransferase involved in cell wall biosynthesis